jgi:hypothetical protein
MAKAEQRALFACDLSQNDRHGRDDLRTLSSRAPDGRRRSWDEGARTLEHGAECAAFAAPAVLERRDGVPLRHAHPHQ